MSVLVRIPVSNENRLTVTGLVGRPREFSAADLAALETAVQLRDVAAIDPQRKGTAVTLAGLLAAVAADPAAKYLTLHATADDFHASIPLETVRDRGLLIYQLNNGPLPVSAGGPFRFYIRDYLSCHSGEIDECANVKFVDRIELSAHKGFDNRPHDDAAHAKLHGHE